MANRIISIEVGYSLTKVCEMDFRAKNPKIYKYFSIPTPEGMYDDGYLEENPSFVTALKQAIQFNKMKSKQAVCTITSSKIATREVQIPAVKSNQVQALVEANASDYFPINLMDFEIGHLTLGTIKEDDGSSKLKVLVMACHKQLIQGYDKLCEGCGLHLVSVDYSGNSVYQVMKGEIKEETEMVIRIEEKQSVATIISGQNMEMQRNVVYGIENAVYTMMNNSAFPQKTYEEALEELKRITCIRLVLNDSTVMIEKEEDAPQVTEKVAKAMKEITESLAPLVGNIARVLDLYNSKNPDKPIKRIQLIGLGAEISGLSKLFTNELGVKTITCRSIKNISWNQGAGNGSSGRYVTAIGAGIAPVGFINEEKKTSDLKDVNYRNVSILVAVLSALLCGVLFFMGYSEYSVQKSKEKMLNTQYDLYAPAEAVYNEYNAVIALSEAVDGGLVSVNTNNDALVSFLEDLERNLPLDAEVVEIQSNCSAENPTATIKLQFLTLEEGAKVIDVMRAVRPNDQIYVNKIETKEMSIDEYREILVTLGVMDEKAAEKIDEDMLDDDGLLTVTFENEDGEEITVPDFFYIYQLFIAYDVNKSETEGVE